MLSKIDQRQLDARGITSEQIEEQLHLFQTGFPFLEIVSAAKPGKGILVLNNDQVEHYLQSWNQFLQTNASVLKFVPASGAASRMFKDLYEFLDSEENAPTKPAEKAFFEHIHSFAFYQQLNEVCQSNNQKTIDELIQDGHYKNIVENLLQKTGLNYGSLPKGLLTFHTYPYEKRTPLQEHLVEGSLYANTASGDVNIHFTVSKEHRRLFEKHLEASIKIYEKNLKSKFHIEFSEQKPSTDTIAVDANNEPFIDNNLPVFRPGGHGALIANLNDLNADVIFIKNIDNVVIDRQKEATVIYKKVIAGLLVQLQAQTFAYLKKLEAGNVNTAELHEIAAFCEKELSNINPDTHKYSDAELKSYLFKKLNRPMRVCGMVKNTGEPGGGPFLIKNQDGSISPQILESSQIDLNNPAEKAKMMESTHFNPVDLVCAVKNYKGEKFDLTKYIDKQTGFISSKSKNGKELKALELPGLWNGAMSDWNTIFVEVPIETFNPVKTVNDLLRPAHK